MLGIYVYAYFVFGFIQVALIFYHNLVQLKYSSKIYYSILILTLTSLKQRCSKMYDTKIHRGKFKCV